MKIRRIFWIRHYLTRSDKWCQRKMQSDFPFTSSIEDCRNEIFINCGRRNPASTKVSHDWAEIISSTICETSKEKKALITKRGAYHEQWLPTSESWPKKAGDE